MPECHRCTATVPDRHHTEINDNGSAPLCALCLIVAISAHHTAGHTLTLMVDTPVAVTS